MLAADNTGLARIELYDDKKLYSTTRAPNPPPHLFSTILTWKPLRTGPHHLQVIAFDIAGNQSPPVELTFDVVTDNRHPVVQFTNFVGATDLSVGAPLLLQGVATDDVAITRVDLYVDDSFFTFVAPDHGAGLTPFAFSLMWVPPTPGTHKLYLRAHDSEDQTGDSPPLLVNALPASPPALVADYERDEALVNDALVVHVLALSPNGVTRVELWADDQLADAANSVTPDGQTVLDTPLVWPVSNIVGDHTLLVRAYDRSGLSTSSTAQVIHVRPAGARLATATTAPARPTPTPLPPTPTATPQVIVPAPPTILVSTVQDPTAAQLDGPLHIRLNAHGADELDHVELWAVYQGETTPILVFTDTIKGSTDKTLTVDWLPPQAGVVQLYARVVDQLGQTGNSPAITVYLISPALPTATPAWPNLGAHWSGAIPTGRFELSFVQIGHALRGAFVNTPADGAAVAGNIITGDLVRDRVTFSVDLGNAATPPHALDFDCLLGAAPAQLTCNYLDEAGNRGSVVLTPVPGP